eukprot:SAG25_NODE_3999_length_910_cov_1.209618_2_plen_30_part_01
MYLVDAAVLLEPCQPVARSAVCQLVEALID